MFIKILVLVSFFLNGAAHAVTHSGYDTREWLNPETSDATVKQIEKQIESEPSEVISDFALGASFGGLDDFIHECLKEIHGAHQKTGQRPRVADVGAGAGAMTWKILAAGGAVDAIELQRAGTLKIQSRMGELKTFFGQAKLKDILKIYNQNALKISEKSGFFGKYDFIWIGNVFHLMAPRDFQNLSSILFKMLRPGGKVFVEADTIHMIECKNRYILTNALERAIQNGVKFPGLVAINGLQDVWTASRKLGSFHVVSTMNQVDLEQIPGGYPMRISGQGFFAPELFDDETKAIEGGLLARPNVTNHKIITIKNHSIMNYLEENSAKEIFSQTGFSILDSYHMDRKGKRIAGVNQKIAFVLEKSSDFIAAEAEQKALEDVSEIQDRDAAAVPPQKKHCAACGNQSSDLTRCGRCKVVHYCDRDCQKNDWPAHKGNCARCP